MTELLQISSTRPFRQCIGSILVSLLLILSSIEPLRAQFEGYVSPAQAPQAQSESEFDQFLECYLATTAKDKIFLSERFLNDFPMSALRGLMLQIQMVAYGARGQGNQAIAAAEKALLIHPNNINTLIFLARTMPGLQSCDSDCLIRAKGYAQTALVELKTIRVPRSIAPQEWTTTSSELEANIHECLGYIAAKLGFIDEAIREFETGIHIARNPADSLLFRTAVVYEMAGRQREAEDTYARVLSFRNSPLRQAASEALSRLKSLNSRKPNPIGSSR